MYVCGIILSYKLCHYNSRHSVASIQARVAFECKGSGNLQRVGMDQGFALEFAKLAILLEIFGVWYFDLLSNWLLHWNFGIWKQAELASEYLVQSCITSSRGVSMRSSQRVLT